MKTQIAIIVSVPDDDIEETMTRVRNALRELEDRFPESDDPRNHAVVVGIDFEYADHSPAMDFWMHSHERLVRKLGI